MNMISGYMQSPIDTMEQQIANEAGVEYSTVAGRMQWELQIGNSRSERREEGDHG